MTIPPETLDLELESETPDLDSEPGVFTRKKLIFLLMNLKFI